MIGARRLAAIAPLACGVALAVGVAPAQAGFVEIGSLGGAGAGAGQLSEPRSDAVNNTTHDVYVADTGNNRVEEFNPIAPAGKQFILMFGKEVNETKDGEPGTTEAEKDICTQAEIETKGVTCKAGEAGSASGEAAFSGPKGVAVDNSGGSDEGDVYVADTGNGRVEVFNASGAYTGTEFEGSQTPETSFSSPWGLTVDGEGDVYVADHFHFVIDKFSPLGAAYIASPYLTGLENPTGVAVDSNTVQEAIYVANREYYVKKFSYATGAEEGTIDASSQTQDVAVNTATNDVFVSEETQVSEYGRGGSPLIESFGSFPTGSETTIAVDSSTGEPSSGDVYVVKHGSGTVAVFAFVEGPTVTTGPAEEETATSATLTGTVNTHGSATEYWFKYGLTEAYSSGCGTGGCETPHASAGAGTTAEAEKASIVGLEPNETYHYKLFAKSDKGASEATEAKEFTMHSEAPTVTSESSGPPTQSEATLEAQINPNNESSEYHFEYGTSPVLGGSTSTPPGTISAAYKDESVSQALSGLKANTAYYYRVVASNTGGGRHEGTIQSFLTEPATPAAGEALDVGATQATIVGMVNPEGHDTHYYVQYGATACASTSCEKATGEEDLGSGTSAAPVAVNLRALKPRTTYHYRLVVANSSGASYGVEDEFTTPPLRPEVSTGAAGGVTQTSATIRARSTRRGSRPAPSSKRERARATGHRCLVTRASGWALRPSR